MFSRRNGNSTLSRSPLPTDVEHGGGRRALERDGRRRGERGGRDEGGRRDDVVPQLPQVKVGAEQPEAGLAAPAPAAATQRQRI